MDVRRVLITGMGCVTSLGLDVPTTWEAVVAGRSGVRQIRQFDSTEFPVRIGSEVDFETVRSEGIGRRFPYLSRSAQFGVWALDEAWRDARLEEDDLDPWRAGVCIGSSTFPIIEESLVEPEQVFDGDDLNLSYYLELCRQRPELLSQRDISAVATLLAWYRGLRLTSISVQTACASANQAVGESFEMIRDGQADLMVTGGADSMMTALCVTGFTLVGALSKRNDEPARASRPFDRARDGFVLGEGAGILILEEREHALRRGAPVYAEVIGYGSSSDAYRFTDVHPEGYGAALCMRQAIASAGIAPEEVGYINAHGTSTPLNDRAETRAIRTVFGAHADRLAVSSTKSQLGHLVCAAGGIEAIFTALALHDGILPPTINLDHPDHECDLDYVPQVARRCDTRIALSPSFGFGGQNSALMLRRWDGAQA